MGEALCSMEMAAQVLGLPTSFLGRRQRGRYPTQLRDRWGTAPNSSKWGGHLPDGDYRAQLSNFSTGNDRDGR